MIECRKRQTIVRDGQESHRCNHRSAPEYRQPVGESACMACPLRVYTLAPKHKSEHSLPILDGDKGFPPCEFRLGGNQCGVSGLPVDRDICNRCVHDSADASPGILGKAVKYASAVRKWVAAGRPERTDEEILVILDKHCSKCNLYDKVKKVCNSCGCPASSDQPALRNKLRMATEACPIGQFPAKVKK